MAQAGPTAIAASLRADRDVDAPAWLRALQETADQRWNVVRDSGSGHRTHLSERATLIRADALRWLDDLPEQSLDAIVTDPPYSLIEYEDIHHDKLRSGRGGVWRIPPAWDGANRRAVPRFTVLSYGETQRLAEFFAAVAEAALRALAPGGHMILASNPLLSTTTFHAIQTAGFEKRGEIIRLIQTLRGGDRPKGAEDEFPDVTVMPRSGWEPWGVFRKPLEGTVAANLRRWGTGGLRRPSESEPFRDVLPCAPARGRERGIAPHPTLKPQRFMRRIVRAALPLGIGIIHDPFAGSGSTLAAAEAVGYRAVGTERDAAYCQMARGAFADLAALVVSGDEGLR